MFQFRRFPSYAYFVQRRMTGYCPAGLPHSEIPGSMDICSSPRLFAACHVLLRLLMPRHSPCALSSLTIVEETRSIPFPPLGENFISAPSFSSFRRKLVFGEGDGSCGFEPFDLSENSWFSLRIMQALQRSKLYVTLHPFGCCSTINLLRRVSPHNASLLPYLLCHIVQFSRCRLPTAFAVRFEDPTFHSQVFKSKGKSPGGPEWARTTDLTIISRTL